MARSAYAVGLPITLVSLTEPITAKPVLSASWELIALMPPISAVHAAPSPGSAGTAAACAALTAATIAAVRALLDAHHVARDTAVCPKSLYAESMSPMAVRVSARAARVSAIGVTLASQSL